MPPKTSEENQKVSNKTGKIFIIHIADKVLISQKQYFVS